MINLRVFYHKKGRAKYISHLDITRCMQRAITRAKLPVWYTEGFNPHIYLTFALPLSLGYESESESMDFRLTGDTTAEDAPALSFQEVRERLNAALPPDIRVVRVDSPKNKPEAITSAVYEIQITADGQDGESMKERFEAFFASETIPVEKRTKKGVKTVDLKPDCAVLALEPLPEGIALTMRTAAGPGYNINPTLLTDEFLRRENLTESVTHVLRKSVRMADGAEFA